MANAERINSSDIASNVNRIFNECLCTSETDVIAHPGNYEVIEDMRNTEVVYFLEKEKLLKNKGLIQRILVEMSDVFKESGGGGCSFLVLCETKDGEQWTGLHETMAKLLYLGLGTGLMEYNLPRNVWRALPGGMPYVLIKDSLFV